VISLETLYADYQLIADQLALIQASETGIFKRAKVNEQIGAFLWLDKPKAFSLTEPFDFSLMTNRQNNLPNAQ
jgi:hypothetical protein